MSVNITNETAERAQQAPGLRRGFKEGRQVRVGHPVLEVALGDAGRRLGDVEQPQAAGGQAEARGTGGAGVRARLSGAGGARGGAGLAGQGAGLPAGEQALEAGGHAADAAVKGVQEDGARGVACRASCDAGAQDGEDAAEEGCETVHMNYTN